MTQQNKQKIKEELFSACRLQIDQRIQTIEARLNSINESKNNETKSSAGDKYETGRAMMQIEEEKSSLQLMEAKKVKSELQRIDLIKSSDSVQQGSLIWTNKGVYFIAIGIGKIKLGGASYFCISPLSPIGKMLMNKKQGDQLLFNGNQFIIEEIY